MAHPDVTPGEIGDPRAWLEANTRAVSKIVSQVARRYRLPPQDSDELLSAVFAHLVENDYRALRRYRGTAKLTTYLTVVAVRVLLDTRTKLWGKWRPTARARRLGPAAVALERMVVRDGVPCAEASALLGVSPAVALASAPARRPSALESVDSAANVQAPSGWSPSAALDAGERRQEASSLRSALMAALHQLGEDDVELLRLRHAAGLSIASVARACGCESRHLYRKYQRLYTQLQARLAASGVSPSSVSTIAGAPDACVEAVFCLDQSRPRGARSSA